jgi:hypothetical protein
MSRAASWVGIALGLSAGVYFASALVRGAGAVPVAGTVFALLVLGGGGRALYGHRGAQLLMCVAALPLLARFLLVYFRTYRVWPGLPLIALATLTFGLGLLGYYLDRFPGPARRGRAPL